MQNKIVFRIILILLAAMMLFSCIYYVFAETVDESVMTASSIILIDADTGAVLYEKGADEIRAPASTTKLLTAILTLEKMNLDQVITVPAEAKTTGSTMGLVPGQQVSIRTLLYGLLLSSGNDAALALAIAVSGNVEDFIKLMNEKAQEIGMTRSHFVTASGLDDPDHMVTARDMAKLACYCFQNQTFREIVSTKFITVYTEDKAVQWQLYNTNLLINDTFGQMGNGGEGSMITESFLYDYANGMKTGSTPNAGGCLIASATKNELSLIAVILGDKSKKEIDRWKIATELFNYGFDTYVRLTITDLVGEEIYVSVENAPVVDGEELKLRCLPVTQDGSAYITLDSTLDYDQITYQVHRNENALAAPIEAGVEIGTIDISINGKNILYGRLISAEGIMTKEDYAKLTGQGEVSSVIEIEDKTDEKKPLLRRYVWIFAALAAVVVIFMIITSVANNRGYKRNRTAPASARSSRPTGYGIRPEGARRPEGDTMRIGSVRTERGRSADPYTTSRRPVQSRERVRSYSYERNDSGLVRRTNQSGMRGSNPSNYGLPRRPSNRPVRRRTDRDDRG